MGECMDLWKRKKDNVIEKVTRDNKTYYDITDFDVLRKLFGQLLKEAQPAKIW
jgi:dipeptidyl-peptidase-3